jgi:hypothetical protein
MRSTLTLPGRTPQPQSGCVLQPNVAAFRGYVGKAAPPVDPTAKRLRPLVAPPRSQDISAASSAVTFGIDIFVFTRILRKSMTQPLRG